MQITVKKIHKSLNENGYICNVPFAASITSAIKTKPVSGAFLYGPAGTGKSYLPIVLSKTLGIDMYFYQCAPGTREDDLLLKMFPSEDTKSGVEIKKSTVFKAAEASHKKPVMLVLDEWDKTRPTADGFFLDFLQYGRLSIPGTEINANLENMFIFFTANDERDFHEALLRRFPKIDVDPLAPSLVMSALKMTHDGHPHLGNAIKLYERAVVSGMSKPATIQEMRQLLDAITLLGNGSDWDNLVYQYITKTPENHKLLCESKGIEEDKSNELKLDVTEFEGKIKEQQQEDTDICMPQVVKYHTNTVSDASDTLPDDSDVYGMYDYNEKTYSYNAHSAYQNDVDSPNASVINDFHLIQDRLVAKKPLQLTDVIHKFHYSNLHKDVGGEIVVVDNDVTFADLKLLPYWQEWIIRYYSNKEVVARYVRQRNKSNDVKGLTLDMRWTKEDGLTLICCADEMRDVSSFLSRGTRRTRFLTGSSYNLVSTPLTAINSPSKLRGQHGRVNIRKLVYYNHIHYSALLHNDDKMIPCFTELLQDARCVQNTGDKVIYKLQGCTFTFDETIDDEYIKCSIDIYGTPTRSTLLGLSEISENFTVNHGCGIPVYNAVRTNTKLLSKHLKSRGWKVQGRTRTLMHKYYKGINHYPVIAILFDNFVIFGHSWHPSGSKSDVRLFSNAVKIVNQLAQKAEQIV